MDQYFNKHDNILGFYRLDNLKTIKFCIPNSWEIALDNENITLDVLTTNGSVTIYQMNTIADTFQTMYDIIDNCITINLDKIVKNKIIEDKLNQLNSIIGQLSIEDLSNLDLSKLLNKNE